MEFSSSIVFYLHQITLCLDMIGDKILRQKLDISYTQFLILMSASEFPNSNQQQMVIWLNLTRSAVSQNVDVLVQKKLVERASNPQSRRENVILITQTGQLILKSAYTLLLKNSDPLFKDISQKEIALLTKILINIINDKLPKLIKSQSQLND